MEIYFTWRPIQIGDFVLNPKDILYKAFTGLPFKYTFICGDITKDGRHLSKIEYEGDIPETEIRALLKEALAIFGYHEKTLEKAQEFHFYLTGNRAKIEDGKLIFEGGKDVAERA